MATLTPASVISSISSVVQSTSTVIYVKFYAGDANGDVATVTFKATESGQSTAAWSETIAVANLTEISTQQYSAGLDVTSMVQSLLLGTNYSLTLAWSDGNDTSEYVNAGSFAIYDPPVISITSPGATVSNLPLSLVWSITDTTGVASQGVFIHPQGSTIASRIYYWGYDTTTRALSVSASEISLTNGATYTVTVHVVNGVGIQRNATTDFTVSWQAPLAPTATVTNDADALAATITVTAGEDSDNWVVRFDGTNAIIRDGLLTISGTDAVVNAEATISGTDISFAELDAPTTESMSIARVNADGTRWVIATGLSSGASVTDPLPPLGVTYTYTITASAASGATSNKTVSNTIEPSGWALNFGNQAAISYLLKYNITSSQSLKHGGELYHFADGGAGNGLPVWYGTTDRDINGSISFSVKSMTDVDQLNGYCMTYPIAWLRDPYGHRWRAHVLPSVSQGLKRTWDMSVSWDAVRFQEAW